MNKLLGLVLVATILFGSSQYKGSTTASVVLAGGIIKSTHIEMPDTKYKRKNCPVCKGTGKYLSGDGIKMVDCGYCEPETGTQTLTQPSKSGVTKSGSTTISCGPNGCRIIKK
jgi:hypothetical protein